ncbi:LTA synthase family protein [Companilactobacillus nodensis]|uniref:LTA synthase family protein n=1 Tax=Companilactobacillus nodensis TaxID=460870 RepID=UPI00054E5D3F|nr:LTA synthase family protein [Companilactobacillus nodensis]
MNNIELKFKSLVNQRVGFICFLVFLLWIKTVVAYYVDFSLGLNDPLQHIIMIINPIATALILLSIPLYIKRAKISYTIMGLIYLIESIFLYANILYYREFSDFLTSSVILGVGKVSKGLGSSTFSLMQIHDFIYFIDLIILILLFSLKFIKLDSKPLRKLAAVATTSVGILIFSVNLMIAEGNRPQLLSRTFDHAYVVKYLGFNTFLGYDAVKSTMTDQARSTAVGTDMDDVLNYVDGNYAAPNPKYFGKANKKNIIIIHLESFQQFLLGMKINDQEVTPFLNSLYNDNNTISFDNFYHEVGLGRTSDAETMLESGLFGLGSGTFFPTNGPANTFQSAPAILAQKKGYTSAVSHGNVGSFWSRNEVYKNMGYNYFFDQSYYDNSIDNASMKYGMKDKLMLSESVKYLEQLQQPFYTKFITVTNHYPYTLSDQDNSDGFAAPDTTDSSVGNYFVTAHYLDNSLREFFDYLKDSGLYDDSMIVLYGDHYGISADKNKALAPIIGIDPNDFNSYNESQLQKVPFMIHMNGLKGGVNHTYGGEIDVLPTILHLAGVNTKNYIQVGSDLLSKQHKGPVAFRDKNFVTTKYTVVNNSKGPQVYSNETGELINLQDNPELEDKVTNWQEEVNTKLKISDAVNNKDLLRFYTPNGFTPVNPDDDSYNYLNQIQRLIKTRSSLGAGSTSLYSKNDNKSTTHLYNTDAPELNGDRTPIDDWSYVLKNDADN